jgi:DNA repair protein RadA/Sms
MVETIEERRAGAAGGKPRANARAQPLSVVGSSATERIQVPIQELDRVLGGGLVPGSLVLIGGDPGIGKSTLVLQTASALGDTVGTVLYVSAEESAQQIKLRADRLGVASDNLWVLSETDLTDVLATAEEQRPGLLVIDSIQTVSVDEISSAAGSVSQVRECTARLMEWAKPRNTPVMIVGHVTKEGTIAGPRVLEHMVDAVLYLEGDRHHQYRILRAVKNRFGSTDEVGVFEMADVGLREVRNPSEAFLEERDGSASGSTVAVTVEGTRPDPGRGPGVDHLDRVRDAAAERQRLRDQPLQLLVAVLQKRVGLGLGAQDIYANVVGGLRITEPAADLPLALAVASSFRDRRVEPRTVAVGEIGLSGELRSVGQLERRLLEAKRLGFERAIIRPVRRGRMGRRPTWRSLGSLASVTRSRRRLARARGRATNESWSTPEIAAPSSVVFRRRNGRVSDRTGCTPPLPDRFLAHATRFPERRGLWEKQIRTPATRRPTPFKSGSLHVSASSLSDEFSRIRVIGGRSRRLAAPFTPSPQAKQPSPTSETTKRTTPLRWKILRSAQVDGEVGTTGSEYRAPELQFSERFGVRAGVPQRAQGGRRPGERRRLTWRRIAHWRLSAVGARGRREAPRRPRRAAPGSPAPA